MGVESLEVASERSCSERPRRGLESRIFASFTVPNPDTYISPSGTQRKTVINTDQDPDCRPRGGPNHRPVHNRAVTPRHYKARTHQSTYRGCLLPTRTRHSPILPPVMDTEQAPATDAYGFDTQPDEPTQQTQQDSQSQPPPDDHLWGYLIPHNPTLIRCDFFKIQARYRVGRRAVDNDLVFPGTKISACCTHHALPAVHSCIGNSHAIIHWDGTEGPSSRVTVTDLSSNGTYVRDECTLLRSCTHTAHRSGDSRSAGIRPPSSRTAWRSASAAPTPNSAIMGWKTTVRTPPCC